LVWLQRNLKDMKNKKFTIKNTSLQQVSKDLQEIGDKIIKENPKAEISFECKPKSQEIEVGVIVK